MALKVKLVVKDELIIARLNGEIDEHTTKEFKTKLFNVISKYQIKNVLFNLKELTFMDSTGIGLMLNIYNKIKTEGKLYLTNMNKNIEKIVLITGLYKICDIIMTENEAIEMLEVS